MATASRPATSARAHSDTGPRARITPRAAVLLAVLMVVGMGLVYPVRLYVQQRGELAELQQQTHSLVIENEKLTKQVEQLQDPVYLEWMARKCFGMVKPGETAFVVIPKGGEPQPTDC